MSTIDTSTWNPDADLNTAIEGIPLNADAGIAQTWQVIRILMAAFKGDTSAIQALMVPFSGATASADGVSGFVPAPEAGEQNKVLKGDGTWDALSVSDIPNIDASKITSGTIDLARLPAGALERLVTVADQTARFALTTASVQLGDTVKQLDTGLLYFVVDTAHLDSEAGYAVYTAGAATSVLWSGVSDKPTTISGYGINDAKIVNGTITLGSSSITPLTSLPSHNQASSTINAMTGYSKPSSTSAIAAADSLNAAIGKLEKEAEYLGGEILLVDAEAANGVAIAVANQLFVKEVEDGLALKADGTHVHGNVTNDGKIGSAAGRPIITGTNGLLQAGAMIADAQIDALFD